MLGENEIFGQMKAAYARACHADTNGFFSNACFHRAFRVGKRVRHETALCVGSTGYGASALEQAHTDAQGLDGRDVLLVGTGDMAEVLLRGLSRFALRTLTVAGRSPQATQALAMTWKARAATLAELPMLLATHDIVFSATAAPHAIIHRDMLPSPAHNKPLYLYDLTFPRDIDASVGHAPGVTLRSLTDLHRVVTDAQAVRQQQIPAAEAMIEEALQDYDKWTAQLPAVPSIKRLERVAEDIRQQALREISDADMVRDSRGAMERMSHLMMRRTLCAMIEELKNHRARSHRQTCAPHHGRTYRQHARSPHRIHHTRMRGVSSLFFSRLCHDHHLHGRL